MATPSEATTTELTWRRYKDGDHEWESMHDKIFVQDTSYKCPTYIHKTPPCQGSCPSGEDIRGWLAIVRQEEKPAEGMDWKEYAFRRSTDANPFPSMMGRVCPAPCQDGCNRNEVEDFVGINAVEQFIGDNAIAAGYKFQAGPDTGKKVAIIGGGPAGLAAAYQLRRKGHAVTIFEMNADLGGMFRYGIPGYRVPREQLSAEIKRIIDMGVEVKFGVQIGKDVPVADLERDYGAILWAVGCQSGRGLPVPGWEGTPNCVSGVAFLKAFNEGRMKVTAEKVVCVGGGDTSIDVVSVARRIGHIGHTNPTDRPELVVHDNYVMQDTAVTAARQGAHATLTSLFTKENMTAAQHEVMDALQEGVVIRDGVMPIELVKDANGRAIGLKIVACTVDKSGRPSPVPDAEPEVLEADLIVAAVGQGGDLTGLDDLNNGRGFINADAYYQVPGKKGHFVAGDVIRPHLLTTAIGQASIAAESIDAYLGSKESKKRPKVDVHHFDLLRKLAEQDLSPVPFDVKERGDMRGTQNGNWAVHNYDDRSFHEVITHEHLFLGHFKYTPRLKRGEEVPTAEEVLGHFKERLIGLSPEEATAEAKRCMSCGMCFECDNCVIYCPQIAIYRVNKKEYTTGRYVATDYSKCIGCHICSDVCPTGYIQMGLGE
jgi:NADPH-dependent glutamate synthase beta subunit-like oxidoreductase